MINIRVCDVTKGKQTAANRQAKGKRGASEGQAKGNNYRI